MQRKETNGQPFDPQRWDTLHRGVFDPNWEAVGEGILVLEAAGARLFRVSWEFDIDKMNTGSEAALSSIADALKQHLAVLCQGKAVSFETPQSQIEEGPVTVVKCRTRGIIG